MKKFISILTAAALTAGLAAFAAGCGGSGDADLENGTLSAKGYASLTEAATACVTEEIAGDTTAATYKSYTAERLLEDTPIEKLNITDEKGHARRGGQNYLFRTRCRRQCAGIYDGRNTRQSGHRGVVLHIRPDRRRMADSQLFRQGQQGIL